MLRSIYMISIVFEFKIPTVFLSGEVIPPLLFDKTHFVYFTIFIFLIYFYCWHYYTCPHFPPLCGPPAIPHLPFLLAIATLSSVSVNYAYLFIGYFLHLLSSSLSLALFLYFFFKRKMIKSEEVNIYFLLCPIPTNFSCHIPVKQNQMTH